MKTTIDHAGRVVIPKAVREKAGLTPGVQLDVEYRDGKVEIEPALNPVKLVKKGSLLVAVAPPGVPRMTTGELTKIVRDLREQRAERILRPKK